MFEADQLGALARIKLKRDASKKSCVPSLTHLPIKTLWSMTKHNKSLNGCDCTISFALVKNRGG